MANNKKEDVEYIVININMEELNDSQGKQEFTTLAGELVHHKRDSQSQVLWENSKII